MIAAKLVEKQYPQVTLYEFRHERQLKRDPEKFTITLYREIESNDEEAKVWKQEDFYFVPDGFLDFRIEQETKTLRAAMLLELALFLTFGEQGLLAVKNRDLDESRKKVDRRSEERRDTPRAYWILDLHGVQDFHA